MYMPQGAIFLSCVSLKHVLDKLQSLCILLSMSRKQVGFEFMYNLLMKEIVLSHFVKLLR